MASKLFLFFFAFSATQKAAAETSLSLPSLSAILNSNRKCATGTPFFKFLLYFAESFTPPSHHFKF